MKTMKTVLEDRFQMLPDEILILIISHLKLKEAAQTSVLSRMWRNLWQYTSGILDFVKSFDLHDWSRNIERQTMKMRFVEWVNLVLGLHKGSDILEFRVRSDLSEDNSNVINSWISFALERHVKRLVLDFGPCQHITRFGIYALRRSLFSNCTSSLSALHLVRVKSSGEDLQFLLSKFPLLQVLYLESIILLVDLNIGGPLPSLKRLAIRGCRSMRSLEVYAINLLSFTYRGPKISVFFKVYPRLVEANIRGDAFLDIKVCRLSRYFSELESLVLDLRDGPEMLQFPEFPKLCKLRTLELCLYGSIFHGYLDRCAKLLEASPSLLKFVLKMYDIDGCNFGLKKVPGWTSNHEHVKVVELVGFLGQEIDLLLVHSLLDRFPSLKKLYVDPRPICKHRALREWDFRQSIAAAQHLQYSLPPNAQLEIAFRHHDCFTTGCYHYNY